MQEHRERLEDLRKLLKQAAIGEIHQEIKRDIRREVPAKVRLLKGEQLDKLISGYFDRGKQSFEMQSQNGPSTSRHDWATAAYDFGRELL